MTTTTTARMRQIADDLRAEGAYTAANSVDALTAERDNMLALLAAALPFCNIAEQVTPAQINKLREVAGAFMTAAKQWIPNETP